MWIYVGQRINYCYCLVLCIILSEYITFQIFFHTKTCLKTQRSVSNNDIWPAAGVAGGSRVNFYIIFYTEPIRRDYDINPRFYCDESNYKLKRITTFIVFVFKVGCILLLNNIDFFKLTKRMCNRTVKIFLCTRSEMFSLILNKYNFPA